MIEARFEGVEKGEWRLVECDHEQMVIWTSRGGRKRRVIAGDEVHATLEMELFST
jgi:hypothetical protein